MTYEMLGTYTLEQITSSDFKINFQIPDNCFYNFSESGGSYIIAIKLNPGETNPSTTFTDCSENAATINKCLDTTFWQYDKTGTINKKPKINIVE